MPAVDPAGQLAQIIDKQAGMAIDIALILERTLTLRDHETRIRGLESVRAKLGAWWAGAAVLGAVLGWLAAYLSRR